jgi:sulfoxide reductase catalytic subunit YedY
MSLLINRADDIPASEITDRALYLTRRDFIRTAAIVLAAGTGPLAARTAYAQQPAPHGRRFERVMRSLLSTAERPNPWEHITTYNNFWEFGEDKSDPAVHAHTLKTTPWTVAVSGECAKPAAYSVEDVIRGETLEDRIYRHRCVEGWSMVIPWVGFPLANFIKRCEPTSKAKFIEFTTLADSRQMPGVGEPNLRWPYIEALRLDEAMHPLTILAVGLYGEVLPNQNGAPIRLVIPWKYGFKSIKSIVKVRFVEKEPTTTWHDANPPLYGFWANVNPDIYPQESERRIGEFFKRRTLMFNGYADQVAGLYAGMNLTRFY